MFPSLSPPSPRSLSPAMFLLSFFFCLQTYLPFLPLAGSKMFSQAWLQVLHGDKQGLWLVQNTFHGPATKAQGQWLRVERLSPDWVLQNPREVPSGFTSPFLGQPVAGASRAVLSGSPREPEAWAAANRESAVETFLFCVALAGQPWNRGEAICFPLSTECSFSFSQGEEARLEGQGGLGGDRLRAWLRRLCRPSEPHLSLWRGI